MKWLEDVIHNYWAGLAGYKILDCDRKELASEIEKEMERRIIKKNNLHAETCSSRFYCNTAKGDNMCDCGMIDRNEVIDEIRHALGLGEEDGK